MNCWQRLGIAPTADAAAIRSAFAAASRSVHPEEHPEEFRELHDAYKQALKLARLLSERTKHDSLPVSEPVPETAEPQHEPGEHQAAEAPIPGEPVGALIPADQSREASESTAPPPENGADLNFDEILVEEAEDKRRMAAALTQEFFTRIARLNALPAGLFTSCWRRLFHEDRYQALLKSRFFIEKLTDYVYEQRESLPLKPGKAVSRSRSKLRRGFFLALSDYYHFSSLTGRSEQGILHDLYRLTSGFGYSGVQMENRSKGLRLLLLFLFFISICMALTQTADIRPSSIAVTLYTLAACAFFFLFVRSHSRSRRKRQSRAVPLTHAELEGTELSLLPPLPEAVPVPAPKTPVTAFFRRLRSLVSSVSPAFLSPELRSPLKHISQARYYSAASVLFMLNLILIFSSDAQQPDWLILLVLLPALICLPVMLLTNIIVFFRRLFTRQRTRAVRRPILFWSMLAVFFFLCFFVL